MSTSGGWCYRQILAVIVPCLCIVPSLGVTGLGTWQSGSTPSGKSYCEFL